MPQDKELNQDKLFEIPAEPESVPERPDLDMDHFTPGADVPAQREVSSFRPPEQIRGEPTEDQVDKIERLEDQGFGTIQAKRIVLGGDFIDPGLPPGVEASERPKNIKGDRRKLSPQGRISADDPVPEAARAEVAEGRVDESAILEMPAEERQANAREAKRLVDGIYNRFDREDAPPQAGK